MTSGKMITAVIFVVMCLIVATAVYVLSVAGDELASTTRFVIRAIGIVFAGGLVILLIYLSIRAGIHLISEGLLAIERIKQARQKTARVALKRRKAEAEARKLERDSELTIITTPMDHQVHISDMNPNSYWQARHLEARTYANGPKSPQNPQPWELRLWLAARNRRSELPPATSNELLLAANAALPAQIDLADLLPGMRGSLKNIILGVRIDEYGQTRIVSAPMYRMCHIGAAGATDSGKSNFGRAIAYQVFTATEAVKVVVSDLKATTFKAFTNAKGLLYPIIHSPSEFMAVMEELSDELRYRKECFKPYPTVETLMDYNKTADTPLPFIVVFIDEISNLFMTKETQAATMEMLREARAFGMYFTAMGQSWSHREMSTSIRQQFRTGLHFGTNDPASSRMIVNNSDAVKIVIPGRALASLPFGMSGGAVEIQTPLIDAGTALRALEQIGTVSDPVPSERPMPETTSVIKEKKGEVITPQPTEKQAKILELWDQGVVDKKSISRQVYGRVGGRQYELIEATLAKFGRI